MYPLQGLSPIPNVSNLEVPARNDKRVDYAYGPKDPGNKNQNRDTLWELTYTRGKVFINRHGEAKKLFLNMLTSELAFAFDKSKNIALVSGTNGVYSLRRYSPVKKAYEDIALPDNIRTPRIVYDLKDPKLEAKGDTLLFYFRDKSLYYLSENTDYQTEVKVETFDRILNLEQVSMNEKQRLQFRVYEMVLEEDIATRTEPSWENKPYTTEVLIRDISDNITTMGDVEVMYCRMRTDYFNDDDVLQETVDLMKIFKV